MPKALKLISLALAAIVLLIIVGVAAILILVDPNDYKDDITQAVHDATGRELTLSGEIGLSIFPWLGLSLGQTSLSNAAGFGAAPFAQVNKVDIKVKLLPLLQQRLEMKTIHLDGLQVSLSKKADGSSNWDDLAGAPAEAPTQAPAEKPAPAETTTPKPQARAIPAIAIGGLELTNAAITWDDQQAKQRVAISKLSLITGPVSLDTPIDLDLSMDVALSEPKLQTPIKLKGQIAFDLEAQRYSVKGLNLQVNAQGDVLPVSPLALNLSANVAADLTQGELSLDNLQLSALDTHISGQTKVTGLDSNLEAKGRLAIAQFSPKSLLKQLAIELPEMADKQAMSQAQVDMHFSASPSGASLDDLKVQLDQTHLSGKASVKNFDKPAIRYDLTVNEIDVDRYLPPPSKAPAQESAPVSSTTAEPIALPMELLRGLDIDGQFHIGKLKAANARATDIAIGLKAKDGLIQVSPTKASLYDGTLNGALALDAKTDTPKFSVKESLENIVAGPLLKDLLGDDKVHGTGNVAMDLRTQGLSVDDFKQHLNGTASFRFKDGAVKGVNIGQLIREAHAKLKKKPAPPKTENQTDFAEMSGSVSITNGLVKNNDLDVKSPLLRIDGKGEVNLPKERINYLVNTSIVESAKGQAGEELDELKSLTIPIKVTGTFSDPKFSLDLKPILEAKAKQKIEEKKEEVKEKVEEKVESEKAKAKKKLEDKLKNKLKSLF